MLNFFETKIPDKPIKNLVIFLHGYGANGQDLLSLAPYFQEILSCTHCISPDAPNKMELFEGGYYWFELSKFDEDYLYQGVIAAKNILQEFIDAQKKRFSITEENIILVGFSQGTMLALHQALENHKKYKAIIGFSGGAATNKIQIKQKSPICLIHGKDDTVLVPDFSLKTQKKLEENEIKSECHILPNLEHSINHEGIRISQKFLQKII